MGSIRLQLVDGLQLVKLCLCASQTQSGWLLHQTQLGVDVSQLVRVAQRMPEMSELVLVDGIPDLPCSTFSRTSTWLGRRKARHEEQQQNLPV